MAEEFEIIRANLLPAAGTITDNDMILIIQGGRAKRALPSAMKGKQGDPGLSVFLGINDKYILWKQGANGAWQNLLEIEQIRGPKGERPIFRKLSGTLQMKYEGEPDSAYVDIFDREELKMKFSDLTPAEVDQLKLHFSDLADADKAELMKPATDAAKEVRDKMDVISEEASRVNQDLTNDVNLMKKQAGVVISETNAAKQGAIEATEKAQSVSDHPGYIGSDYHVYTWDYVTGAYKKTETILRPEGFSIYRTYNSIDAMNADIANVPEGKFVLINTNDVEQEDNAKLYVRGSASFEYLVDMSGAIGFTGKTPGFTVGTVTEGDVMDVTVSENGTDEDGNPLYKLNFVIRRGPQGFTPVISVGTVTTGLPGTNASAEFVPDGETEEGEPKSLLNLTIPRGDTGSVENVYQTREIDHVPDETDLGYQENGVFKSYPIGAEVYYREAPGEVTFYKLFDIVDGKAVWDEAGGGTALPGNVYLQGANYYNESVTIIKEGYINE